MKGRWSRWKVAAGLVAVGLLLGLTACGGPSAGRSELGDDESAAATRTRQAAPKHPADTNSDNQLSISEVTAYGAAWKSGQTWPADPNPIPIEYVTNAGSIWKTGEVYHYDSSANPPFVAGAGSASAPSNDLTVSGTTGAVRGTVTVAAASRQTTGRPAVWITVGDYNYYQTASTDGGYGFGNLSGGSYPITAALPGYERDQTTANVTANTVTDAAQLHLAAAAEPSTGGIVGRVENGDGAAVPGALVAIQSSNNLRFTGSDGEFNFPELPAGRHTITAQLATLGSASVEVEVSAGQQATATLVLTGGSNADQPPTVTATAFPGTVSVLRSVSFDGFVVPNASGATITAYAWDFESDGTVDATSQTTPRATHSYTTAGTYEATLTATDSGGRTGRDTVTVVAQAGGLVIGIQ